MTQRPYTAGSIYWAGYYADDNLFASLGQIQTQTIDTTRGMSGGAMIGYYAPTNSWYAVGTDSNSTSSWNYFSQMTWEVQGFIYQ